MFDSETIPEGTLPEGLTELSPGPELGTVLASVDRNLLSGYDRVVLLQAHARQVAHYQAEFYADVHSVHEAVSQSDVKAQMMEANDIAASEIRAGLTLTRRSADYHLSLAWGLIQGLPQVWEALRDGVIDLPKARIIVNQTVHLEQNTARNVAEVVLERASTQTTGELGSRIRKLAFTIDPESAKTRYEQGVEERRITSQANEDGTTNLYGLDLPVDQANAAMKRINTLARASKRAEDPRTMDQIRADVFLDLLNGRNHQHARNTTGGVVDIHVDLRTLAELSENPGELAGYGPVIADIARQVGETQADSEWRYTVTDPDTGQVIVNGTTRRRPTTGLKRHVHARNPICVFPGCRMPAIDCDLDHSQAWADGGPTTDTNLAPFCRHDHVIKHQGWNIQQLRPGSYTLTSPLGHTYPVGPDPP